MMSNQTLQQIWRLIVGGSVPVLLALCLVGNLTPAAAESQDAETIARMAMSTASVSMMDKHEHEIGEALEEKDFEEALEEAEELVPWMKGTPWLSKLAAPAEAATDALQVVVEKLKAGDEAGANAAFEAMTKEFKHLHHELMEVVGGEQSH
jgi:hypothetical protein